MKKCGGACVSELVRYYRDSMCSLAFESSQKLNFSANFCSEAKNRSLFLL